MILFKNAKVITEERIIDNGGVIVEKGKIIDVFEGDPPIEAKNFKEIDLKNNYLSPGFIDIHTHGGGGYDFMDGTVEAILKGASSHLQYGTTSIVPTTLTSTKDNLFQILDSFKEAKKQIYDGPNLLGIHLEGPYFSYEQRGAQDPKYIRDPDAEEYMEILNYSNDIVRWTIAPEKVGALKLGRILNERNILPAIGHSNTTSEQVEKAYEQGYNLVTHLYSGMSMTHRIDAFRYAGVVEGSYLIDEMYVEVIADGVHLPSSLLKLAYKIKGPDRICLITDSMRAATMPDGNYILGNKSMGQEVVVENGVAMLPDKKSFAGSVATADILIRTMINKADVPLQKAVKMATITPAKVMGVDKNKGSITAGKDADLIVFNNNIEIKHVMINGEIKVNKL